MATELAKAYVQIIPTAEGIKGKMSEMLGGEADAAGKSAGQKAGASAGSSFGSALASAAKVGMAALAAGGAGVAAIAKEALSSYADYEQLVGGVETLFKDAAGTVQEYAAGAYKTAGMSANDYMETVTSFSASLLQSLDGDTAQAASVADMAIRDMSDNANKMGSDMSAIQNAYQGFAKQNYTMLDNLKLGYGGTKTEMERLLADATALSGVEYDINSLSDVYEAIHVIQTELDITGTTAKEASSTISGSLGTMKAAWSNLITGVADENANMSGLIDDFVDSVFTVADNIVPRIGQILSGVGQLVTGLAPVIADGISMLISDVLPSLLEAGVTLIGTLGSALLDNAPMLVQTALDLCLMLGEYLVEAAPELVDAAITLIEDLADWIGEYASVLAETAVTIITSLAESIMDPGTLESLMYSALTLIEYLAEAVVENIPQLLDTAIEIIDNLVDFLIDNVGELIDAAVEIIITLAEGVIENLPKLIGKAPEIIQKLVDAIIENVPKLIDAAIEIIVKLTEGIIQNLPQLLESATQIVFTIAEGIVKMLGTLIMKGKEIVDSVKNGFDQKVQDAKNWGRDLIANFIAGIKEKWEALKSSVSNIASTVKNFLGHSHPTEGPMADDYKWMPDMMESMAKGIRDNRGRVLGELDKLAGDMSGRLDLGSPAFAMAGGPAYGAGAGNTLQAELRETLEALRNMQVVLSTGEFVGAVTAPINRSLGNQYTYARRGIE